MTLFYKSIFNTAFSTFPLSIFLSSFMIDHLFLLLSLFQGPFALLNIWSFFSTMKKRGILLYQKSQWDSFGYFVFGIILIVLRHWFWEFVVNWP